MKHDGLGNDNTYFQNKTKMNRTKSPPETGSANLISTQIQERSKTVDTSRETTLAQRTEQNLGHKICCWPIFWKAEEQPRCVRTGESWNLILDSWESKKLLKHPDCSGCWQCSLQNCFQAEHFFFFPSENANSLQWKHCRIVSLLWLCERSQAVFLPNSLAPHSPPWQDLQSQRASILHINPSPHPNTSSPSLLNGQAPAGL